MLTLFVRLGLLTLSGFDSVTAPLCAEWTDWQTSKHLSDRRTARRDEGELPNKQTNKQTNKRGLTA